MLLKHLAELFFRRFRSTTAGTSVSSMEAIQQLPLQQMDRPGVRDRAAGLFDTEWMVDDVTTAQHAARLGCSSEKAASV
jgi:hypothetical protein